MRNGASLFCGFLIGVVTGVILTRLCLKESYEKMAQEEVESIRDFYRDEMEETLKPSEYERIAEKYKSDEEEPEPESVAVFDSKNNDHPYVISPGEFGEFEDYSHISLTYYADKYLTDSNDELLDNIDEIVGVESLSHFGEYEDDSVFVRNDALKCDYEILYDPRRYSEIFKNRVEET